MKRSITILLAVVATATVALTGYTAQPSVAAAPTPSASVTEQAVAPTTAQTSPADAAVVATRAGTTTPEHGEPVAPAIAAAVISAPEQPSTSAATTATTAVASTPTTDSRTAYITAMYLAVVPAGERAALAGRFVIGYNLPGVNCGTGCTGLFGGQARSSFNATFMAESIAYQRNTLAHEVAHAYGFLFLTSYATPSWAGLGGWQAQFNRLDRSFVGAYDAEAWAACVAWQQTGFNNRIDQISRPCTTEAAALAMAHIA